MLQHSTAAPTQVLEAEAALTEQEEAVAVLRAALAAAQRAAESPAKASLGVQVRCPCLAFPALPARLHACVLDACRRRGMAKGAVGAAGRENTRRRLLEVEQLQDSGCVLQVSPRGPSPLASRLRSGADARPPPVPAASPSAVESRAAVQRPPGVHLQVLVLSSRQTGRRHPLLPSFHLSCSGVCALVCQAGELMLTLPVQEARAVCPEGADLSETYHPPGHARGAASAAAGPALPPHSPGATNTKAHLLHARATHAAQCLFSTCQKVEVPS